MQALGFTHDDLEANRAGYLTERRAEAAIPWLQVVLPKL
jgi:hypothetical protein